MNKKIFLLILGLLLVSVIRSDGTSDTTSNETPTDEDLCSEATTKDACFKVELSSKDKQCCFYTGTNTTDNDTESACSIKMTEAEKENWKEDNFTLKEECNGKFVTTSILVLLALLFL